ncbi:MAG: efflux RND transporter periplasmic adaptor subunit [Bacteroidaceae bacterium]|nr:efflux RND transporter periplasmic adaptor subunit [Bacteroidaceae bacterium]
MKFIAIASFTFMLTSCFNGHKEEKIVEKIPVKSITVESAPIAQSDRYIGTIVESRSSTLSFEVPGNVKQVLVSEGDKVVKGQLLAILNKGNIANNYSATSSTLKQAQDTYDRMAILYKDKSISKIQYIDAETQRDKALAAESTAKKEMNDCRLYAPFSGIIGERLVEPGTNMMAGLPAFILLETKTLKAKVSIPENEIGNIHLGTNAQVKISALNHLMLKGVVSQKGIIGNRLSHTYEIKITLISPSKEIMPGMLCDICLSSDTKPQAIVIPANSIQLYENNARYVWVINHNGRVHLRQITVGSYSQDGVVVLNGLQSGERIVTEGFQKISEGSVVIEK